MKVIDEAALGNALCFDYAVELLRKQAAKGIESGDRKDIMLSIPATINCVFSCELFLKSLLPVGTRGHLLYDLFCKLGDDDKDIIRNATVLIMQDQGHDRPLYARDNRYRSDCRTYGCEISKF